MKLLAAFGLLAVALAVSSQWPVHERSFTKGNTYEFEWKGQIVSGVPVKGSSSHSLQQIRSKVLITFNEKHSILRLDNVKISNGHKQLTEPRIISEVSLEESQLTSEQREQIQLPIRFRYHQGIISEIVFSEEESTWSENIKRSVLNMLQVQMTPRKTQEEFNQDKYNTQQKNKFFTVTERTLEGECEVAYTIVEGEKNREEKEVTKSLNFETCPKRIDIRYGPRYSAECSNCEATDARPESQTVISYKIRGEDEERFLIQEVELKSEYVFTPFSKEQEMLATYVHQKMRLVNVKSAERVEEPRNGKKSSLLYNYEMELAREKFWMNGDEESYKLTGFEPIPKKELMDKYVRLALASMEESDKDGVTLETNHNFARMVEVFRMCTEKEIQEIHRHFWESDVYAEKVEKVREFLADALIAAGTKNTIEHFVEKVEKKQISPIRASLLVKGLVNTRVPSEKIVYSLMRLAKSKVCREEPVLRQSVLLTAGALMNGVCSKKEITKESWAIEIEGEKECRRELKTEWLKEWETLFESATTRYEKVLVLKAVANSALDMSIHFLEKVIYERRHPIVVRQAAVDALRMLREQMPRKVQSVCLPLFKSRREPVSLRISALYQLVHSRPERSLLDQIVHQLNVEPSLQVRSFGVSLLRSFAESKKNPCEVKLAEDINVALRMLRASPLSASTHVHLPWYSRVFDFGLTMDLASVFSNESVLPNELLASVDSIFAGQWNKHLVQVGLYQNNLDQILIPLLKKLEKSESEIVVRGQRSSSKPLRETLKELVRQMKIQSRQSSENNGENAFGMLYLRYKNLDFAVLPMEEELIEKMVRDSSSILSTSEIIRKITKGYRFEGVLSGFAYEHVRIVPTTFGLPLQVTSKLPTVASIRAHIKAELSPKMSLRVEMEPSFVSTHVTEMTVFSPEMHLGVRVFHSVQSTLPINGQVEYNTEKDSLKAVFHLPKEEKRVILIESRPTTFVRSFNSKQVPLLEEKTIRIPSFEKTSVHYEQTYGEELFGLRTEVIGSVHRRVFEKKSPESILFGENHVQVVIVPTAESVKEVVIEIEPKYTKESSSFESPRYDETFTEEEFGLETSDESEERQDERITRRSHSKKYYESMKSLKGLEGRLNIRIHTVGGPKTLKGEMSMKGSCDEEIKVCRFEIQGKRSPLLEKERRDWEMLLNGEVVLPESPKTIQELKEMRHKEVEATLKCRWGAEEKNEMTIRLQKTQSAEMTRMLKNIDYESNKGLEKYDMLREASKLNKYVVIVDKEFSQDNEKVFRRLFDLVKSEFYMSGSVESVRSDSRRIKIEAVVEPEQCRRVNFTVECNGEKLIVKEVFSPIRIPLMSLGSRRVSLKGLNKNSWTSVFMSRSECEVSSNKVSTFDGLVYKTPLTTCYSVLAKDCSQEPEYVVMMKKMEKNSEEKKLKIVTQEKEYECELKSEKLVCKIDGRRVEDEETLYDMGIKLIGESSCEITIPKMTIRFDGYNVEIKADKRTENTQCGLCGHFDGHRDNEFRRADNEETEDIEEFHRSWLRRDNECEIEEQKLKEKKHYGVESDEEERYNSEESLWTPMEDSEEEFMGEKRSRKMLKKNLKKHISRKNIRDQEENTYEPENEIIMVEREGKTCFSMEEQPKCQPGDELLETENKKVKLSCLPRSDRRTRRIVNALKRGEESIKEEINALPMSLADRIELPKLCRVY